MLFEYFTTAVVNADIEIENVGECSLLAMNDLGEEYVLIIETRLGISRILTYGPCVRDFDMLPKSVTCNFKRINFDQGKLAKIIKEWLNNVYFKITSVQEVGKEEALEVCKDLPGYMKQDLYW